MVSIPAGKRGKARQLSSQDERTLTALWLDPANNRSQLAERFGLSRMGAYKVVKRFLKENAPGAEISQGPLASTTSRDAGSNVPDVSEPRPDSN